MNKSIHHILQSEKIKQQKRSADYFVFIKEQIKQS